MNTSNFEKLLKTPIHNEDGYLQYVRALYEEWNSQNGETGYPTHRKMSNCIVGLRTDLPPQFFTGDIRSPFVIISLNPHADADGRKTEIYAAKHCQTWEDYLNFWTNFSHKRYAQDGVPRSPDGGLSYFDCKLHRFLSGSTAEVTSEDLSRWNMFHVELFPIASPSFDVRHIDESLFPYILRMLEVIALYPRTLVLVLNRKLERLLRKMQRAGMLKLEDFSSLPITISGKKTRAYRQMYTVMLNYTHVKIVAAKTFAMQGFDGEHLISYSQKCFSDEERVAISQAIGK